jgi:chemotaxis protein histidine kinase CheA
MTSVTPRPKTKVRYYRMRNRLKDKAGGGSGGVGSISQAALEKAEAEFKKMAEDYPDWVGKYVTQLYQELSGAREKSAELRSPHISRLNKVAHELKGQGGTFGYPLISTFGKSLYDCTDTTEGKIPDNLLEIIKAHIDAMQAVIKGRVAGDGGEVGAELAKSLNEAIAKFQVKT